MAQTTLFPAGTPKPEVSRGGARKAHGIHYTPTPLARFVARRTLLAAHRRSAATVLDPACGDGELLLAVADEAERMGLPAPKLVGIDRDQDAIDAARERLAAAAAVDLSLLCEDFLAIDGDSGGQLPGQFDIVVSNPPYVRTQVLGRARAQALAKQFGLTGRVDLYHAFVAAMTQSLKEDGVLGLLCSNRFISTKGGTSLRELMLRAYHLQEVWDLGDTKLFEAAVLPAVVVGRRSVDPRRSEASFVRVYEDEASTEDAVGAGSVLDALESETTGAVRVGDTPYLIERGHLHADAPARPWRVRADESSRWLDAMRARSSGCFGDLGKVRVGVKTTADAVFIKQSWDDLPAALHPEPELLHPLLTHHVAARWTVAPDVLATRTILYPHEIRDGRRRAVDLDRFPRAAAYLEQHRERLAGRTYVRQAGRAWYEIWVPQQPDGWALPKLVWPDISERPKFFLDDSGAIVNGDCYWMTCGASDPREIALALAVANSTVALSYYDLCCGNRLYAGRRRFITQYVQELPLPDASGAELDHVHGLVDRLCQIELQPEERIELEAETDAVVSELFGVKEISR